MGGLANSELNGEQKNHVKAKLVIGLVTKWNAMQLCHQSDCSGH